MNSINPTDDAWTANAAQFKGNMEMLAAFIAHHISAATSAKPEWIFSMERGDYRRRKDWMAYGFLTFKLTDGRSGTVVAGISGPLPYRFGFDGALKTLGENIEIGDLPKIAEVLVDDLIGQLGLTKRAMFL